MKPMVPGSRWDPLARRVLQVTFALVALGLTAVSGRLEAAMLSSSLLVADPVNLVDLDSAMKILFEDSVFDNSVSDSELLDLFEMDSRVMVEETTGGRYIETAQYFQLPAGVRAVATGDYIPVPDGPVIKNSRVYLKKIQGVVEMLGDVMRRVRTNEGAFLDWGERALPDLVIRLNDLQDRMMLGFGGGILGRIAAGYAGAGEDDVPIDRNFGVNGLSGSFLNFLEGKRIVASVAADGDPIRNAGVGQSANVVDAFDGFIKVKTAGAAAAPDEWVANDYLFDGDDIGTAVPDATGQPREFMGLLGMVDDGSVLATFQEIVRADFRKWQSVVIDAAADGYGGELSEDLIVYADDQTLVLGGGRPDAFVTSRAANRQYWRKLRTDRVLNDPRGQFAGGLGGQQQGGREPATRSRGTRIMLDDSRDLAVRVARKMPPELAFGLQTDTFKRWQLGRWVWDDTTGSIWNRSSDSVGRKDAYFAVGHLYIQMGNFAPRKSFKIKNLSP